MKTPTLISSNIRGQESKLSEFSQETMALTKRLFLQLIRRPSTLIAGILQPFNFGLVFILEHCSLMRQRAYCQERWIMDGS